ncbi:MAG: MFS transporter [Chloroflexi bacterium]|nr:MFS transporter [Chloroflexota bacterium]
MPVITQPLPLIRRQRFYYGWVIVATVALASFSQSAGTHPVLSVLLGPITSEFGWSRTLFTGAVTVGTLAGAVAALFVGRVIDRLGGRWILTASLFLLGLSFVLMAFITAIWQLYFLQIMGRMLTMGVVVLALQVAVPKWFIAKRGLAVALAGLGGMAGNTVTPLYVQWVINVADWRLATFVAGVVIWVVSVLPVAFFMRRQPEDIGLLPDGAESEAGVTREGRVAATRAEVSFTLAQVVRFPAFYLLAAAFVLMFMVMPGTIFHLLPYLTDKGLAPGQGVWVLATWSAAGAAGALLAGLLAPHIGIRRTLAGAFTFMALGLGFLLAVNSFPLGLLWGLYMGVLVGGIFSTLYQVTFADYFGRESLGRINGVIWPAQMVSNAAGPLVAAVAYDITGSYTAIFTLFGLLVLACATLTFFARPPRREV